MAYQQLLCALSGVVVLDEAFCDEVLELIAEVVWDLRRGTFYDQIHEVPEGEILAALVVGEDSDSALQDGQPEAP